MHTQTEKHTHAIDALGEVERHSHTHTHTHTQVVIPRRGRRGGGGPGQGKKVPAADDTNLGPDNKLLSLLVCCRLLLLPLPMPHHCPHHRPIGIVVAVTAGPLWLAVSLAACGLGRCRVRA